MSCSGFFPFLFLSRTPENTSVRCLTTNKELFRQYTRLWVSEFMQQIKVNSFSILFSFPAHDPSAAKYLSMCFKLCSRSAQKHCYVVLFLTLLRSAGEGQHKIINICSTHSFHLNFTSCSKNTIVICTLLFWVTFNQCDSWKNYLTWYINSLEQMNPTKTKYLQIETPKSFISL